MFLAEQNLTDDLISFDECVRKLFLYFPEEDCLSIVDSLSCFSDGVRESLEMETEKNDAAEDFTEYLQ